MTTTRGNNNMIINKYVIRTAIVLLLLIGLIPITMAMSFGQAQNIYRNLIINNRLYNAPPLYYINSNEINAYASANGIYITRGALNNLNRDELALALAHELGHLQNGHTNNAHSAEYGADQQGAIYAKRARYNVCKGKIYFKKYNYPDTPDHPSSSKRYKRIKC